MRELLKIVNQLSCHRKGKMKETLKLLIKIKQKIELPCDVIIRLKDSGMVIATHIYHKGKLLEFAFLFDFHEINDIYDDKILVDRYILLAGKCLKSKINELNKLINQNANKAE